VKSTISALMMDMDGVLYHGEKAIPEALLFMATVRDIPHVFITNNPILPPAQIADRLERLGFARPHEDQIVTSAEATAMWLAKQKTNFRYYAVGAEGLHLALQENGIEDALGADFVVIGEGAGINYETLTIGINLILKNSAELVVTNPDHTVDAYVDGQHRVLPGGGSLVAPFETATGKRATIVGKPQPLLYQMAAERLGVRLEYSLIVGDRPDTDIAGAVRLGMRSALVRSGRFSPGAPYPKGIPRPDWDVNNLSELLACVWT
jgi:HAD superfamily hydrolase (TIGR01450 family)